MTLREHLALPIAQRIHRYENEYLYGYPDDAQVSMRASRSYRESDLNAYVLYRLKREEFELKELEREFDKS